MESTDITQIIDKLRLSLALHGIATIAKLKALFDVNDNNQSQCIANEEFTSILMKCSLHLSKFDTNKVIKKYKASETETKYNMFLNDLSPELVPEREQLVKELFNSLLKKRNETSSNNSTVLRNDLLVTYLDTTCHPKVHSGQFSASFATDLIKSAFHGIPDEISYDTFKEYFRGISAGYPFNFKAFQTFIQRCWHSCYDNSMVKSSTNERISISDANQYFAQIEALLAEKVRQKCKGSEGENQTLIKKFKHHDLENKGWCNLQQFLNTLETFGVIMPTQEAKVMFSKWTNEENDKIMYKDFVEELFRLN